MGKQKNTMVIIDYYLSIAIEISYYGFYTLYMNSNDTIKNMHIKNCANSLKSTKISEDIILSVFNALENMERRNINILLFDYKFLGEKAYKIKALAKSLFYFEKGGVLQNLIHLLKYRGKKNIAIWLGEIYGNILKNEYNCNFDYIIPVPLYLGSQKKRGYNQSEMISIGLNKYLMLSLHFKTKNTIKENIDINVNRYTYPVNPLENITSP